MQCLKQFTDFYQKHYPKNLKERLKIDVDKEIFEQKKKLRAYFFNCNLKKNLPKNPPMNPTFVNKEEGD